MKLPSRKIPFAVLLLACLFSSLACQWINPGPARTVVKFYEALSRGNLEDAKQYLDPDSHSQIPALWLNEALARATEEFNEHGGLASVQIAKEQINGDLATVEFVLHYKDKASKAGREKLMRKKRKWLIVISK